MSDHDSPRIKHVAYAYADGSGFGDHYITLDHSLATPDQFDVTIFPRGDNRRPPGDMYREIPHIRIRTWDGNTWRTASVTPVSNGLQYPQIVDTPRAGEYHWHN